MAPALDGMTVLDLGSGAAAAIATLFLADHGARVIRVLAPGDALHRDGGFIVWDRGKEALRLDLDQAASELAAGRDTASAAHTWKGLVSRADVVVDDLAPGSGRQVLLAPAWLQSINPRLVACSITAYGKRGPLKDEPAIDELVLARMGVLGGMPGFRPPPVHVVHPLPSVGAALHAVIGTAASLLAREKTGRGRFVETSLMAGALLYHPKVVGQKLARHVFQTHPSGSAPFYSVYPCADGRYVQLGCVHAAFIAVAAKLMGLDQLILEPRFDKGRAPKTPKDDAELRAAVTKVIATKPYPEWAAIFEAADVPFGEARWSEAALDDPQVAHNGMVVKLDDPVHGAVVQMGVPVALSATPGRIRGPRAASAADGKALAKAAAAKPAAASTADPAEPPLAGVRVLEITNLIAGPTAGRLLADLGADVIKLEPPEGDMSRPIGRTYFYSVNFNKRSISVDPRKAAGREAVLRIAASADALLANLRPHATERMGIGAAVNPRLIEVHLTGYGWTGPYAHRPGIDPLAQALMGLQRAQGGPENPPVFPAQLAPTDYTNGAMGAFGLILALLVREKRGIVQRVDANLLSGGILLSSPWFTKYAGKPERPLADKEQMGLGPFHRLFKVADGWIYIVAATPAEQENVCVVAMVAMPAAAGPTGETGGHPNTTPFARELAAALGSRKKSELLAALKGAGVPCAEAMAGDSELFLGDPHATANGMVAVRQHAIAGELKVAWQYTQLRETRASQGRPTPLLGEHTAEILREAGYNDAEISQMLASGAVKTETPAGMS